MTIFLNKIYYIKIMTKEKIIEEFYNHLKEIEGGISNLKYNLGDEYDDAKQDCMIRLIKYVEKNEIDEIKVKGLIFITLKNICLNMLNQKKKYTHQSIDDKYDLSADEIEILEDDYLSDANQGLKERILEHITQEEYNLMVEHFNSRYDRNIEITNYDRFEEQKKINTLKQRMGFKKYYILLEEDGSKQEFKFLGQIAAYIGCDKAFLNVKIQKFGNSFTYKKKKYTIRTIANISDVVKNKHKK